ncbi:hypothetical protein BpHYR1_020753 [Brachionus plicatilis]|uniref:Uncharacterized protein n=1 Tax=Brachionus plicatilis TaxID=10195 RepID=A0A3M7SKW4_BRAPC|nr:hypothetical protein BpHYR1_020753 [Brachionus plicatilis]
MSSEANENKSSSIQINCEKYNAKMFKKRDSQKLYRFLLSKWLYKKNSYDLIELIFTGFVDRYYLCSKLNRKLYEFLPESQFLTSYQRGPQCSAAILLHYHNTNVSLFKTVDEHNHNSITESIKQYGITKESKQVIEDLLKILILFYKIILNIKKIFQILTCLSIEFKLNNTNKLYIELNSHDPKD